MSQSDFVTRGQALVTAGQYQEAVKVCRLGLLGRPTTVEGRVVLGQALLALKRFDEVLAEMRVALELDHTAIPAQTLKGEALLRKGDAHAAFEVLARVRSQTPGDPRVAQLIDEAERSIGQPRKSAAHPAVGFVSPSAPAPAELMTRAYVPHAADEEDTDDNVEGTGDGYTRPTSLAPPGPKHRTRPEELQRMIADATPPPAVLAVGDRSGTVEVDPDIDGVEVEGDDDFADLAAPPKVGRGKRPKPAEGARGQVMPASRSPAPARRTGAGRPPQHEVSTVELGDDEVMDIDEIQDPGPLRRPGPGTAVRNAVKLPSGPIEPRSSPAATRPTAHAPAVAPPAHLAQMIANQPRLQASLPPPQPLPPPPNPRSQLAAALPTAAAMPLPSPFAQTMVPRDRPPAAPAAQPTLALNPAQQQTSAAVDAMFGPADGAWGGARAGADEPTRQPHPVDPNLGGMFAADSTPPVGVNDSMNQSAPKPMKTGMRRARSRLQVVLWILLGAAVIGGGVFAGFQIRAIRLGKKIAAAREQAVALAKADTWKGWVGARDHLAGIAQASSTPDNRAALARTRALVAFEFGDGYPEAKLAVDALPAQGGLDARLAAAYLALAQSDAKAARAAADAATSVNADDAAVLYVTGQAHLLAGDFKPAIASLRSALEKEPRPLYAIGLAQALGAGSQWEDAIAAVDRALAITPDHPGALITRAMLLAASGRIVPNNPIGTEVRVQLEKVIAEATQPAAQQPRGVSPAQVAFADLALARVDFARGDLSAAQADVRNALAVLIDEQRFAEEVVDTLFATGAYVNARTAAERVLAQWPASKRARATLAELLLVQGRPAEALDVLAQGADLGQFPRALAVRGHARMASGDLDAAAPDFEAALKRAPHLELALVGRAWLDLATGDIDAARRRIEPKYNAATASPPIATVYAAILRASNEPGARDKARAILEKAVVGPPSRDVAQAQLELARVYRDLGEVRLARGAYEESSRAGLSAARLEAALLLIEDRDPAGGRLAIDALIQEAGDRASAGLLVEGARARMLVGDHPGAATLIEQAEKAPGLVRWTLERERGRLALRRADYLGSAQALLKAIEACDDDAETFLLAADTAVDGRQLKLLERVKVLAAKRLAGRPEALIIAGKIALYEGKGDEAAKAYEAAAKAYEQAKATPRRKAQANFGRAVTAYNQEDDPNARSAFEVVMEQDPSIFAAYLYLADMVKDKEPKRALELAQLAVKYNPDLVEGWSMLGAVASKVGNRKLRADAITRVGELAPNSEALRTLQRLP